ncbi:conserved hypothetical protein [Ricinus communis]|uniref:Uncharacterized protein n=1 Tax=Ricinus communis TaxID=3988 RepID=B9SYG6_RICCO|nr:conserved hypothetical protein [Ricinus communis]
MQLSKRLGASFGANLRTRGWLALSARIRLVIEQFGRRIAFGLKSFVRSISIVKWRSRIFSLKEGLLDYGEGVKSVVGVSTKFWLDVWLGDAPLSAFALKAIGDDELFYSVNDYWIPFIGWDWPRLMSCPLGSIVLKRAGSVRESEKLRPLKGFVASFG